MEKTRSELILGSVPLGTLIDLQPLQESLKILGDEESGLHGLLWAIMSNTYWTARQPDQAKDTAQRALRVGQHNEDFSLCAYASFGLAQAELLSLHAPEALVNFEEALRYAQRTDDLWLQGWPLQRIPLVFISLGRLEEAWTAARNACVLARESHDWSNLSLALATLASIAVIQGDFAAVERYAFEAMEMTRRSPYPWGGVIALSALACARSLRGKWDEATDAIDILLEPGRLFREPGPAVQFVAWIYRQLLQARSNTGNEAGKQNATTLQSILGVGPLDLFSLESCCASVEISDLVAFPGSVEQLYHALSLTEEQRVIFSNGWGFLIPRILGIAATLQGWWDKADAHLHLACEVAAKAGAWPELGRSYLDYARMLVSRNKGGDHARAGELLQQAGHIFRDLGMIPFTERVTQLAETLQTPLLTPRQPSLEGTPLTEREVEVLCYIARGWTDRQIADELLLSPATVSRYVRAVLDKTGVKERSEILAYGTTTGLSSPTAAILFTDIKDSTVIVRTLGDEKSRVLFDMHDKVINDCVRLYRGNLIKYTGDGVMAIFSSAANAITCTIAIQEAIRQTFATHNQQHPEIPLRIRSGLHAGGVVTKRQSLSGLAIHIARRICDRADADQILVSHTVRQLSTGSEFVFTNHGDFLLKGLGEEPFQLYAVQWKKGGD
jgi:class 3 adenylate cyclase/tetratricopeptide (TPR) repeat protein